MGTEQRDCGLAPTRSPSWDKVGGCPVSGELGTPRWTPSEPTGSSGSCGPSRPRVRGCVRSRSVFGSLPGFLGLWPGPVVLSAVHHLSSSPSRPRASRPTEGNRGKAGRGQGLRRACQREDDVPASPAPRRLSCFWPTRGPTGETWVPHLRGDGGGRCMASPRACVSGPGARCVRSRYLCFQSSPTHSRMNPHSGIQGARPSVPPVTVEGSVVLPSQGEEGRPGPQEARIREQWPRPRLGCHECPTPTRGAALAGDIKHPPVCTRPPTASATGAAATARWVALRCLFSLGRPAGPVPPQPGGTSALSGAVAVPRRQEGRTRAATGSQLRAARHAAGCCFR